MPGEIAALTEAAQAGGQGALAVVLGHASPDISVAYYLSSLEWLQFLMVDLGPPLFVGIHQGALVASLSARQLQQLIPLSSRH